MRVLIFLFLVGIPAVELTAQQAGIMEKKLSVLLRKESLTQPINYILSVTDIQQAVRLLSGRPHTIITRQIPEYNLLYVRAIGLHTDSAFMNHPSIRFIDLQRIPKEEKAIDGFDPGTNYITSAHRNFPTINGNGMVVSIKEKLADSTDIDFKGRIFSSGTGATNMSTHATNMATMIAGGGNSDRTSKGVAWGASITSSDFMNLIPDPLADYHRFNISVQNHSYGTGIENYYGADAAAYDKSVLDKPELLHVFSSGNLGDQPSTSGRYQNLPGFANLTGSFKMSKNTLTVGAIDSFYNLETLSSRGPAYDGRVKPELVAYGHDGSSGAAAIVSGAALLMQQVYWEKHNVMMPAALTKAILINTAEDVGAPGIDFASGFGSVHVEKAVRAIVEGNYFLDSFSNTTLMRAITVPAGTARLSITLAYTDPPAAANAEHALVNDLDLLVTNLNSGISWRPWVLNPVPVSDSLQLPAVRKKDSLNNIEQVTIDFPDPGTYAINVSGSLVSGIQPFSIAYDASPEKKLFFTYPTLLHPIHRDAGILLRWSSTFTGGTGVLESSVNGSEWQLENGTVNLSRKYYQWKCPDTSGWVVFRFTTEGNSFLSDTIVLTGIVRPKTAFYCADSLLLTWNAAGVDAYRVYRLGEKYMEPFAITTDTSLLIRNVYESQFFAVAPLLPDLREGQRSYGFDYSTQGAGCYVNTFLADNMNDVGQLTAILGTSINIQSLVIEKFSGNRFVLWKTLPVGSFRYEISDTSLTTGINLYRLKITLVNQQIIYSAIASLFHFNDKEYILYPNPVKRNSTLTLAVKDADDVTFILYNSTGGFLREIQVTDNRQQIPVAALPQGIYFYRILKKNQPSVSGRFIIY